MLNKIPARFVGRDWQHSRWRSEKHLRSPFCRISTFWRTITFIFWCLRFCFGNTHNTKVKKKRLTQPKRNGSVRLRNLLLKGCISDYLSNLRFLAKKFRSGMATSALAKWHDDVLVSSRWAISRRYRCFWFARRFGNLPFYQFHPWQKLHPWPITLTCCYWRGHSASLVIRITWL